MAVVPMKLPEKQIPTAFGYYVLVRIWITPDKIGNILVPGATKEEDKYSRPVGQVIAIGKDAYKPESQYPGGPWCEIGDWVIFNRGEGFAFNYFGDALAYVPDNKVLGKIEDPNQFRKINTAAN